MAVMAGSNLWARAVVRSGLMRAGRSGETRFMVTPVFGNPLRREVIGRLKEIASTEQAVLLEKLGLGGGRTYRPLWIVNAIALELTPD